MLTRNQLMEMSDLQILKYIFEVAGYNDLISVVQAEVELKFSTE
jgi:hypothetical protein